MISALPGTRGDLYSISLLLLYCAAFAGLRIVVSPVLELDEVEQFLDGRSLSLGYPREAPLYTWVVWLYSQVLGLNLFALTAVKYTFFSTFLCGVYCTLRHFRPPRVALIATSSLTLFITYGYEFNRHLTHTVLAAALASVSVLVVTRLMVTNRTFYYPLLGVTLALGMLSKYNFAILGLGLCLAGLSFASARERLFDRRVLWSVLAGALVVAPHVWWLFQVETNSFSDGLGRSKPGGFAEKSAVSYLLSIYVEVLTYLVVFGLFFWKSLRAYWREAPWFGRFFVLWVGYSLAVSVLLILTLQLGHFSAKWLAPVLFLFPLGLFLLIDPKESPKALCWIGRLCALLIVGAFGARLVIGLYPGLTGKPERVHVPFYAMNKAVRDRLAAAGVSDLDNVSLVATKQYLTVNLSLGLIGSAALAHAAQTPKERRDKTPVLIWHAKPGKDAIPEELSELYPDAKRLRPVEADYYRAGGRRQYQLGLAIGG